MRNRARIPLSKAKVRQSWSKYNLYNLSRLLIPSYKVRTFFQQKWTAKSLLRAYHSEPVREGLWERMFSPRLRSVIPMNPAYLASNDGSLESAGRGSGLDKVPGTKRPPAIPYMQMTFAPLERRLDTAIFRAMFASSARQARQFVVHGAVKVNGKKMKHPGYLLNPGDMFQVEPERVMFATGAPKDQSDLLSSDDTIKEPSEDLEATASDQSQEPKEEENPENEKEEKDEEQDPRQVLKSLLAQAKSVLSGSKSEKLSAKRKQDLRGFSKQVKRQLSRSHSTTNLTDSLEAQFLELKAQLLRPANQLPSAQLPSSTTTDTTDPSEPTPSQNSSPSSDHTPEPSEPPSFSDQDFQTLQEALSRLHHNPIDPSKPYATPWTPRPYMSAFAFIPRYLEVNHNICAAVYLRHPVARPGLAEVPTPFGEMTGGDAFAWYLRRR